MKFNIKKDNVKSIISVLQGTLLILLSVGCITMLANRVKGEKTIQSEKEAIEKLEKRVSTIEGLIMTQQICILEESLSPKPQAATQNTRYNEERTDVQQPEYRETTPSR